MKYILIVGDGMADEPIPGWDGRTPLQKAFTPGMDRLAREGCCGLLDAVPAGCAPGSETAMLSLLGYDPRAVAGRGALEALGEGISLASGEWALRVNLLSLDGQGCILNHHAGGITTPEAIQLIEHLQQHLDSPALRLYPGTGYRHLLCLSGGAGFLRCTPPHTIRGRQAAAYPAEALSPEAAQTARRLNDLTARSRKLLAGHPVNRRRRAANLPAADLLWPWSPGRVPQLESLAGRYGFRRGAVVAGVPLVRGIGAAAGLRIINVPEATGDARTDYGAKAAATLRALETDDFVLVHIEAPDECAHEGDAPAKAHAIEQIDTRIVTPLLDALEQRGEPFTLALTADHPTLCRTREHARGAVPAAILRTGAAPDGVTRFDETAARQGTLGSLSGKAFIQYFFGAPG